MKFLIFVKQVPNSAEIRFDYERKTLIREGVKSEMNAYDRRAITEAIRYRDENGGEVIAATMGPPQAKDVLKEALIMGVDRCLHIQDPSLAGSDTLITSRVLAAAARAIGFDIIFCGQHSTDSETAQVPVELAEILGVPCATAVRKIDYLPNASIQVTSETEEGSMLLEMPLPVVLSAAERLIRPLKTKNADLSAASEDCIQTIGIHELGLSPEEVGMNASPTWVADIVDVRVNRKPEIWDGSDVSTTALRLLEEIRRGRGKHRVTMPAHAPALQAGTSGSERREYWCLVEVLQSQIRPVSLEILSAAAALAAERGGSVCAIVEGALTPDVKTTLAVYGADKIYHIVGTDIHPDEMVAILCEKIQQEKPFAFFLPATRNGKYLAPRIAARLSLGLIGDCVGLTYVGNDLAYLKPAFGGNIVAPIFTRTTPQMATIRPGSLEKNESDAPGEPEVVHVHVPENISRQFTIVAQEIDPGIDAIRLDDADFVVGVGSGLGQENVSLAQRLAELLDGVTGATRRVVDSGWMARQFQIGLTGKFIAPDVYLALGVSGRYNHMIGVQKSGVIAGINQDPDAEIFHSCDIGILGDCVAIAAEMVRILEKRKE